MGAEIALNRPSEVIYQIYPASFYDSGKEGAAEGVGDVKGITQKLDYIRKLNVDAIWINPVFLSPEGTAGDGGYAITDYRKINPRFGTEKDFEELLHEAHRPTKSHPNGLRVYTDFVPCHTSNEHEWFKASSDPRHPDHEKYKDYYVWHDGRRNDKSELILTDRTDKYGRRIPEVPNNWRSVFGGSAWEYNDERGQFYLHHFNVTQPALNLNSDKVQEVVLGEMKHWLDKGVDGLRIDALPFANYDPQFRDDPQRGGYGGDDQRWRAQDLDHSMCQPQTVEFVAKIRKLMDSYPALKRKTALGEVVAGPFGGDWSMEQAAGFVNPKTGQHSAGYLDPEKGLHSCYTQSFVDFWYTYPPANRLRTMIKRSVSLSPDGGLGDALDNHDFPRFATRLTQDVPTAYHPAVIKQLLSLWASLPGSKFLYNGDELGLPQAGADEIPAHKIIDPSLEKREYCRTPMPWDSRKWTPESPTAGFTASSNPILPVPERHLPLAVNVQEVQPDSTLNISRRILKQRRENIALSRGATWVLNARYADDPVVAFVRRAGNKQAVFCAFNMSDKNASIKLSDYGLDKDTLALLKSSPETTIELRPYTSAHYGLAPGPREKEEIGMGPAPALMFSGKVEDKVNGDHRVKSIVAVDMLIADNHVPEGVVADVLPKLMQKDPNILLGEKSMIDAYTHHKLTMERIRHARKGMHYITPGGSTTSTLGTLKKLLKDDVNINLMGWAADDRHGSVIKEFLKETGINHLTPEWPEGVPPETAISHIIQHANGRNTIVTYPGKAIEALHRAIEKQSTAELLEQSIRHSDIVYLPESTMSKFGLPFTQRLLESRWRNKKELALSLPTHASFGPTDSDFFRYLIPSCNIVMGNDVEFRRVMLNKEDEENSIEEQVRKVAGKLQATFRENEHFLTDAGMPLSPHGQVALITRSEQPALLVTKNEISLVPVVNGVEVKNRLGAGDAAFAGFLGGYIKGFDHKKSAELAMKLAAEKVMQDAPEPFIRHPHDLDVYLTNERVVPERGNGRNWRGNIIAKHSEETRGKDQHQR